MRLEFRSWGVESRVAYYTLHILVIRDEHDEIKGAAMAYTGKKT